MSKKQTPPAEAERQKLTTDELVERIKKEPPESKERTLFEKLGHGYTLAEFREIRHREVLGVTSKPRKPEPKKPAEPAGT